MGQKVVNTILVILLAANIGISFYLYNQLIQARSQLERMLDGPTQIPGKGLQHYDLSSPETTLKSVKTMISSFDVKAGMDYWTLLMRQSNDPLMEYYFAEEAELTIEKTHVVGDSSVSGANGKVIAFVQIRSNGVDYHDVQVFERVDGYFFGSSFSLYEWDVEEWTDEDTYLKKAMDSWETSGKLP